MLHKIKIYADGADIQTAQNLISEHGVKGFTTNPTLMKTAGIRDYEGFARELIQKVSGLPISFEVFEDDLEGMERQAEKISSWGDNVYVKIPITNTKGISTAELIRTLNHRGIKVNTTAVFTKDQIDGLERCFDSGTPAVVSVFAGRIADAGQDPKENVRYAVEKFKRSPNVEILWASPREVYNVVQAVEAGAHIITVPLNLIPKLKSFGKDLTQFSLETVQMFRRDAVDSGYSL